MEHKSFSTKHNTYSRVFGRQMVDSVKRECVNINLLYLGRSLLKPYENENGAHTGYSEQHGSKTTNDPRDIGVSVS